MSLDQQISRARTAQQNFKNTPRETRVALLESYANALKEKREELALILSNDATKTMKEAQGEVDGAIGIIGTTITNTTLADLGDMARERRGTPAGIVGLITSFNFPIAVAHWTIAPAILAGNAVLWKPSEKTPLVAIECAKIFAGVAKDYAPLMQVIDSSRASGEALVAHEEVDMISATGSVAMGEAIKKTLAAKKNNSVPPILELGGNNGVIIAETISEDHLTFAVNAILSSFLGTTGQRCTNTRRVIVHKKWFEKTVAKFEAALNEFIGGAMKEAENSYGYRALVDEDANQRFSQAKAQAVKEGGKILFGGKGEPALAVMPSQTAIMHTETFAPLLYLVPYEGNISEAITLVNAPDNAGLVNGIYTLSKKDAEQFARDNQAGHSVINSPRGTGTPANGMGFGGNKASGCGEILWSADPLAAFTRRGPISRIAINKDVPLS